MSEVGDRAGHPVDFLGVGMQRAATTWLANSLRSHPEVWLPPRKELHYFSRSRRFPSANYLDGPRTLTSAGKSLVTKSYTGERMRRDLRRAVGHRRFGDLGWLYRYYVGHPDDEWYVDLFAGGTDLVAGEITPDYSLLDRDDAAAVGALLPGVKALILLRHPIDRAWSHLRFAHPAMASSTDSEAMIEFMDSPGQVQRNDGARLVTTWRHAVGDERVWIALHDDIVRRPDAVLDDLARFLDVAPGRFGAAAPINAARPSAMPHDVERHLAAASLPGLVELDRMIDDDLSSWIERCERILDT